MVDNNDGDEWWNSSQWNTLKIFCHVIWVNMYYVFGFGIHIIFNMAVTDGSPLKSISKCFLQTDFSRTEQMLYAVVHMLIFSRIIHYIDKLLIRPTLNAVLEQHEFINSISRFYFWTSFWASVYFIFSTFYGRFRIAIDVNNTEGYSISYYLNAFVRSFFKMSPTNMDSLHLQESINTALFFLAFMYILYFHDAHTHNHEVNEAISLIPLTSNNMITLTVGFISNMSFFFVSAVLSFGLNVLTFLLFNTTASNDFVIILTCVVLGMVVYAFEELNSRRRVYGNANNDNEEEKRLKVKIETAKSLLVDQVSFIFASLFLVYFFFQADSYSFTANNPEYEFARGVPYSDSYWKVYYIQSLFLATAGLCAYTSTKVLTCITNALTVNIG